MFAILSSGSMQPSDLDTQEEYNQKFLDIINCITGASYSFAKFDTGACYINSTVASGWTVVWSSLPLNSFGSTGDIQVLLRSNTNLSGKYAYVKMWKSSDGHIGATNANSYNETTGAVLSGGSHENFGYYSILYSSGFYPARYHVTWLQDLTIKAIPGVLLFNWYNASYGWQWSAGVVERTANAPYEANTEESPIVPFFGAAANTHISRMYNPSTNAYQNTDSRAYYPSYAMYWAYDIKLSRDENGNAVLPMVPIIYTDPRVGYIGGNCSTYSGLYRTAHYNYHLMDNNSTFSYDSKTYRLWKQTIYNSPTVPSFAVEEK